MKVAFDTSVLVAGLHRAHPHHARAVVWVDAVAQRHVTGLVTYHALVELWSVLTRLPSSMRASPAQALQLVDRVRQVFEVVTLESTIYDDAMQRCTDRGFSSGIVFDALHLVAAERSAAHVVVTFNGSDFTRLITPTSPRIIIPPDPPTVTLEST